MNQISCPNCCKEFSIDEKNYTEILNQIRTKEFQNEINNRLKIIEDQYNMKLSLLSKENKNILDKNILDKNLEISKLKHKIESFHFEKEMIKKNTEEVMNNSILEKEKEILNLKSQAQMIENNKKLELMEINLLKDKKISELENILELQKKETELEKNNIKEKYEVVIKQKDETIDFYKDFKMKQSIKIIGETLEKHCETEFNRLRMTAFQNAHFIKDNDSKDGSKGDYIYREIDENGIEIISIMFEMKNECDTSSTKKKNEHFFKELDKDRKSKRCEYAVLVSMLEIDNELYNGITDVSYEYEKMYVIRPQFFIAIISLLRNAASNSLKYKQEIACMRQQNVDITNFEEKLNNFKTDFTRNYNLASSQFQTAIKEIDKTISHLQKTKEALLSSENNLRIANKKAEDITVKKLVRNNKTMKDMFDSLE